MCKSCNGNCYECLKCAAINDGKKAKYGTVKIDGVTFSMGNDKVGNTGSVSLNNSFCDPSWPCYKFCYAKKLANIRPSVRTSYDNNTDIYNEDPGRYYNAVKKACIMFKSMGMGFRYHIDGEMPNYEYFVKAVETAKETGTEIILMTKRYDIVNRYCDLNGGKESIPANLHVGFSLQHEGQVIDNKYNFPTRGFIPKKESIEGKALCPNQTAKKAGYKWSCETCLKRHAGCFADKSLSFMQH